jgi:hypothetical protein
VKFGETVVTLIDKTSKRKCNEHAFEPRAKIRNVQNDQYDNLNIKLDSDDSNIVGSPVQPSLLGDDDGGGGSGGGGGGDDDDECSHAPQQGSQLHLPPENLSPYPVTPSSQTWLAGNVSTAPSSQQLQTTGKVSTAPSCGQLLGSIPTNTETKCSGMVQSASDVGNQMESNPSTSNVVMTSSELGGTSSQHKNFSSLSDSAVTVRVQQPSSKAARQPQVYIPGSVYNLLTNQQGCSTSGSLTLVNAVEDTVAASSHARVPGNVSTELSSQQLSSFGKVTEAPSCGQLVGSIPISRESNFLGTVPTSSSVGTQIESNSSTSNVVMTSSELSGTSSCDNFSSVLGSAVTVTVQQPESDKGRQRQAYFPGSVYNVSICQEDGLPSGTLTLVNTVEDTVAPSSHTNVPGNVNTAHSSQQLRRYGKVSKASSGGRFVSSIPTSKERKLLGAVESAGNVGIQMESNSSPSNVVVTLNGLSGTSSQYENFSSFVNSAVPVMIQQPASDTIQQPLQKSSVAGALSSDERRLKRPPNALITTPNCLVVRQKQKMVSLLTPHALKRKGDTQEATLAHLPAAEAGSILSVSPNVEASYHQLYVPNGAQDSTSLGGSQQAVILEGQHLYSRYDMKQLYW